MPRSAGLWTTLLLARTVEYLTPRAVEIVPSDRTLGQSADRRLEVSRVRKGAPKRASDVLVGAAPTAGTGEWFVTHATRLETVPLGSADPWRT